MFLIFLRGREKTEGFHFSFANAGEVDLSMEPFGAESEIHTIVTYGPETHFDDTTTKFGRSVWRESSFKVITFETQNWKLNFLDIRFFNCS